MKNIVEEIVTSQLFSCLLIARFEEITAHDNFKGVTIVDTNQEKANGDGAKETTYIWQDLVNFLEAAVNFACDWWFIELERCIERTGLVNCISVLNTILRHNSSRSCLCLTHWHDAFVSLYCVVFHHQLTLLSTDRWKHDIITIFKIMTQELLRVSVDERVDEVYS